MTLLLYIVILGAVLFWRSRQLSGRSLAHEIADDGSYYLKKEIAHRASRYGSERHYTLMVGRALQQPCFFSISQEKWYHRFLKALGLVSEIEFGDEKLDRQLFFMSDAPEALASVAANPEFIRGVRDLFENGDAKKIQAYNDKIWVTSKKQTFLDDGFINRNLARVSSLARICDASAPGSHFFGSNKPRFSMLFMAVHAALFAVAVFGVIPAIFENAEILNMRGMAMFALNIGAGVLAAWLALIFLTLRGSGWFALVLADFILVGIIGILASTVFIVREANITLDRAEPARYVTPLIAKQCNLSCSRRNFGRRRSSRSINYPLTAEQCLPGARPETLAHYQATSRYCNSNHKFRYKLTLQAWDRSQPQPYTFETDAQAYDMSVVGRSFEVQVHPGYFGHPWIASEEIKAK